MYMLYLFFIIVNSFIETYPHNLEKNLNYTTINIKCQNKNKSERPINLNLSIFYGIIAHNAIGNDL